MKVFIVLPLLIFSFVSVTQAATFAAMKGTYRITQCRELTPASQEKLCGFNRVGILPGKEATAIYFTKFIDPIVQYRSFGFPASAAGSPRASYREQGDTYASFSDSSVGEDETTTLQRQADGSYLLSVSRKSRNFRTADEYQILMIKVSTDVAPLPTVTDPEDPS
jgi:hypothetical protein